MKTKLSSDLSTLTTINEGVLDRLTDKVIWCICDDIEKSIYNRDDFAEIDLGFGSLYIGYTNNEVKYKFIPSDEFNSFVTDTVINEHNSLITVLEKSLVDKLTNTYKRFF